MKTILIISLAIAALVACSSKPQLENVSNSLKEIPINSEAKASEIQKKHSR